MESAKSRGRRRQGAPRLDAAGPALLDRLPPQDLEAEAATLGSMLIEGEAASLAAERLVPDDFYSSANQVVFRTLCEVSDRGQQPDIVVLRDRLKAAGELETVGGDEYLAHLASNVPSAANIEHYAGIVRQRSLARRVIAACSSIVRDAYDGSEATELLDRAEEAILAVAGASVTSDVQSLAELIRIELDELAKRMETPGLMTGLRTHLAELNEYTGGIQRSDLIILAARPSVGKTALALNLAAHAAEREKVPVLVFSLEMSKEQVARRILSSRTYVDEKGSPCRGVTFHQLRSGSVNNEELNQVVDVWERLRDVPVYVDDKAGITAVELRARARRFKAKRDIGLVIVDYLQLMQGSAEQSREREVAKISAALKSLARELRIPVLALSQLRRPSDERRAKRPELQDLRESGALEQDADLVLLLHRPQSTDPQGNEWMGNETDLIVAKQRNGRTGIIKLVFDPPRMFCTESASRS